MISRCDMLKNKPVEKHTQINISSRLLLVKSGRNNFSLFLHPQRKHTFFFKLKSEILMQISDLSRKILNMTVRADITIRKPDSTVISFTLMHAVVSEAQHLCVRVCGRTQICIRRCIQVFKQLQYLSYEYVLLTNSHVCWSLLLTSGDASDIC